VIITLDLCLRQGAHEIINGLNLHVEKGEFVFICGQAGSGKTSLLRVFALLQHPAGGQVIVEGRDITRIPRSEFPEYRRGLGVVFRNDMLLPHHTLVENIGVALEIIGWSTSAAKNEAMLHLRDVGLGNKAGLFPDQISESEEQLLKICRAIARRPKIILADEPYDALDRQSVEKAVQLFENANLRGSTVVLTTHHVEFAGRLGKRAIMLDKNSVDRVTRPLDSLCPAESGK
jgi:cell division transport system ATP-binding protein